MGFTNSFQLHLFSEVIPLTPKQKFLKNLKGSSKKYKRYFSSLLRYAGGKSWVFGFIIEKIPVNITKLVSPFLSGCSIEIAVAKELKIDVFGFNVFDILNNYWKIQTESPKDLYQELNKLKPIIETYKFVKQELNKHWNGDIMLSSLKLTANYDNNFSYSPGFLCWMSNVYAKEDTYNSLLERVKNIFFEFLSYEDFIPKFNNEFLYCNLLYYLGKDYPLEGFYPLRELPIQYNNFNHSLLRELLLNHKGGFIFFYNDSPTNKKWYKDFEIVQLPIYYKMGKGETRIGLNRFVKNNNHLKKTNELPIIKEH